MFVFDGLRLVRSLWARTSGVDCKVGRVYVTRFKVFLPRELLDIDLLGYWLMISGEDGYLTPVSSY